MKYVIVFIFCIISMALTAQKNTLPKKIRSTFDQKYPGIEEVNWDIENGDYKIKFVDQGKRTTVDIGAKGSWEKTSVHLPFEDLPKAVQATVNQQKKNATFDEIKKVINNDDKLFYRIELIEGENKTKLDVGENGNIIKLDSSTIDKE
jgi:hypothetical protein